MIRNFPHTSYQPLGSINGQNGKRKPAFLEEEDGLNLEDLLDDKRPVGCSRKALLLTGGLTAGVIIIVVVLIVTLGGIDGGGNSEESKDPRPAFTLDDYLSGRFSAVRFNATWVSDTRLMFSNAEGELLLHDLLTNTTETLLTPQDEPKLSISFLQQLSADQQFLLIAYDYQKLFRHSFYANYTVINLSTKVSTDLIAPDGSKRLQLVKWSTVGNALALVRTNNIYYMKTAANTEMIQLTSTGLPNIVYNGVPDWVYEEEVLGSNDAMWFSPDGNKLAYMTFDDTNVKVMTFPYFGQPDNLEFQYSINVNIHYPKPGSPNPTVSLNAVDLTVEGNTTPVVMAPPPEVGSEPVLATVTWSKVNELVAVWMNRIQNRFMITAHEFANGSPLTIMDHTQPDGWVDLFVPPTVSSDGNRILVIHPHNQGTAGDFRHLTLVTRDPIKGTKATIALTQGEFVVTSIVAWDEANNKVFFQATNPTDPAQLGLYTVTDNLALPEPPTCVSCGVKVTETRQACTYVSASFSSDKSYYNLNCNGPDVPGTLIFKKNGELVTTWEDNKKLADFMGQHSGPTKRRLRVPVPGGLEAYAQMLLPPDMDTSGNTKYPMLVNVYGGPDSSQVSDRFVGDWGTYLTTNRSIIYAAIDGRGSGLKGNKILFSGYKRLGSVEIEDQINVTKYLQSQFPFIDSTRTAIWGWSYGGYSTGMALAKDTSGVFRCGMSVAPVTDWIYYDSIYTERYMRLPTTDDNLLGYQLANLNRIVDNLGRNENRYLLIHGTADDNVHYQQSMILSRTLELKDILFQQQSYPDEAHGLNGVSPHLYHTLENFLDVCLDLPPRT
ncbi:venom dipeptidyl peptidase 4 isoform X2 [Neocloeon triangulifer]|uniref:venom dipeptidyl peptidase 4 isoform X2 n=1 Tax=Neocloeon triangulifer TaxID=2078957 RepID=UPI00286F5066|nr:venom dipeptidyl peptidase 4 isoform X2 [Neocloeon triangulifer]